MDARAGLVGVVDTYTLSGVQKGRWRDGMDREWMVKLRYCLLLMVQKSCVHQLRLVVEIYHYSQGFIHSRWLFAISEPSIVPQISHDMVMIFRK